MDAAVHMTKTQKQNIFDIFSITVHIDMELLIITEYNCSSNWFVKNQTAPLSLIFHFTNPAICLFFVVEKPVLLWQLLSQIISKCSLGISCWIMRQNMILHRLLERNAATISTILCFYDCLTSV